MGDSFLFQERADWLIPNGDYMKNSQSQKIPCICRSKIIKCFLFYKEILKIKICDRKIMMPSFSMQIEKLKFRNKNAKLDMQMIQSLCKSQKLQKALIKRKSNTLFAKNFSKNEHVKATEIMNTSSLSLSSSFSSVVFF